MSDILGPKQISGGDTAGYTFVPQQIYDTYIWTINGGGGQILFGQNTPVVIIQWYGAGSDTLTAQYGNQGLIIDSITVNIEVNTNGEPDHHPHGQHD